MPLSEILRFAQNDRELSLRGAQATKQSWRKGGTIRLLRFARNDRKGRARNDRKGRARNDRKGRAQNERKLRAQNDGRDC